MNIWDLTERRAVIEAALDGLAARRRMQPQIRHVVNQLYAQGLLFEAERVAGLAIWLGKEPPADIVTTCGTLFGTFLDAVQQLASLLQHDAAEQPEDVIGRIFGVQADFVARVRQIQAHLPQPLPVMACYRGALVRQVVQFLGEQAACVRTGVPIDGSTAEATAWSSLVDAAAEQGTAALVEASRLLWRVQAWDDWRQVAVSYPVFLTHHLGLGVECGHILGTVGQVFANLWGGRTALRRLELIVRLVTEETYHGESSTADR